MNEQKRCTFVDFLIQLIFVVLFVIILVWLFPTKDYLKENFNNNYYEKDSDITDSVFVNNINNMMEASKSYFGYNIALPEELGDEVTITLDELVENHVMIMPRDKKGNTCSGESYATITKTNFRYSIKVSLTCGNVTDYIIRSVGCDPFCDNNCNTNCKLEYQYVKTTKGYWTDWSKFSSWSTKKVTATETMKVETKVVDTKTCPSGYTLNSSKTACTKTVNTEAISNPIEKLTCPNGYTLKDNKCHKTITTTINQPAEEVLSCPSGYTLNSSKTACEKIVSNSTTTDAEQVITCNSGYTLSNGKCIKTTTTSSMQNSLYTCPSGYSLSGSICSKTLTVESNKKTYYGCNSGYTYISSNKTCMQVKLLEIGQIGNAKCSITFETDCTNGCRVIQKETCIVAANKWNNYTCPSGYTLSSDKKTCSKTEIASATENISYTCPNGYTLTSDNKCHKTEEVAPSISYKCTTGVLNGTKCVATTNSTETKDVIKTYKCTTGKLVDNTCVIDNTSNEVIEPTKSYVCNTGTLKDGKCTITNSNVSTTEYNIVKVTYYRYATKKYVEETKTYKWSTSRNDKNLLNSGYTLTGKTRSNCS